MRSKYNNGELVLVNGIGKIYKNKIKKLGFIIEKDPYYKDYYIELITGKKDWFEERNIERVLGTKRNKVEKYQVRLCTTKEGYQIIEKNLKTNEPISNNKLGQISIYEEFNVYNKKYVVLGWKSVFWPVTNKSIKIIENTIRSFRELDIPFQYIVMNENNLTDVSIFEFIENDSNVDIFSIERKIKIKYYKKDYHLNGREEII